MSNYGPNITSGYNCAVCGMWVSNAVTHSCGGGVRYVPPVQPDAVAMALGRIEALLQQILRKLETA